MPATVAPPTLPAPVPLTDDEAAALLDIAREAVAAAAGVVPAPSGGGGEGPEPTLRPERRGAAFVSVFVDGDLRGCIGMMDPESPLARSVADAGAAAAERDPRFESIRPADLPRLRIAVSVLGPLVPLADPLAFRLGVDGILVEHGRARGLLLPEVATEHGLDREGMLGIACRKAGLATGAWRDRSTRVFAFRTAHVEGDASILGTPRA